MPVPVTESEVEAKRAAAPPPRHWFLRPYVQMGISIALSVSAQIFLKRGATESVQADAWFGVEGLRSPWVWMGIVAMVTSLLSWLYALRYVPLNVAFNIAGGVTNIFVPLSGWIFFSERLGLQRWLGIGLVLVGVIVIAKPAGQMEEKL